jgi:hypothetical protein
MRHIIPVTLLGSLVLINMEASNLPRACQATLLESTSPTTVMVRATGIGIGKKGHKPKSAELDRSANLDARRTAIWYVLLGGTDPLLQTDTEKQAFEKIQENFYREDNIRNFIAWEADYYDKRIKIDNGMGLKIEKTFKINKGLLQETLVQQAVMTKTTAIAEVLGLPTIMVIPEAPKDIAPLELLKTDPNIKKGAEVIESYLTARKYTAIVPEQQQVLQELISTQYALGGAEEDYSYLLALSIGSDVYITYNITIESRTIGSSTVKKGIVGCRAFETTTGRLLGTETGYSPERAAPDAVLIEEAMNDAADKVLSRISAYWKADTKQGVQYKLIVSVSNTYDTDEAEEIIFQVNDILKGMSNMLKENAVSDYSYDVLMWVNPDKYASASDIYRAIKNLYKGNGSVKRTSISRKLILLAVTEE